MDWANPDQYCFNQLTLKNTVSFNSANFTNIDLIKFELKFGEMYP